MKGCCINLAAAVHALFGAIILFVIGCGPWHQALAQDRALIVAIDDYADKNIADLPGKLAENDAALIEKLLKEKLGFKPDSIKVLRNEKATREAILDAFDTWLNPRDPSARKKKTRKLKGLDESGALASKKKKQKKKKVKWRPPPKVYRSFFYYAGLGHTQLDLDGDETDGRDEALIPHDAVLRNDGGGSTLDGMILDDQIEQALAQFKYRNVTLVLDTSYSGFVTRNVNLAEKATTRMRVPRMDDTIASIATDDWLVRHKEDGPFANAGIVGGGLQVWSAASATQTALIAGQDDKPNGLFTLLYVEGIATGKADENGNGNISNAELLRHITKGSRAYCQIFQERCELGLTPRLDPPRAFAGSVFIDRKKFTRKHARKLDYDRLLDFLGGFESGKIEITQTPVSPVHVGATGIGYEVMTAEPGYLILLNLTDKGELFQLYPNQFSGTISDARLHLVKANTPLRVPEKSYGITLSATEPGKGHIIALMTPDPVLFDRSVTSRTIASVSSDEAIKVYLARLSAALNHPLNQANADLDTGSARWFLKALPYEVLPKPRPLAKPAPGAN